MPDSFNNNSGSDDFLGFQPEREVQRELVYDEPFQPGMTLVPVRCGTCRLLMYTSEKNVRKWMVCPDCDCHNEVCPAVASDKVKVEFSEDGALQLRKAEDAPRPSFQVVSDYRAIPGSVDEGQERLPPIVLGEVVDDPLERAFDRILSTRKKKKEDADASGTPAFPVGFENRPKVVRTKIEDGDPWPLRHFFHPFFDRRNRLRFRFDRYYGIIALFMTFNLLRILGQFLFSADPRGTDHVYGTGDLLFFYLTYLLAIIPLTIWFFLVILNGMTLYVETSSGTNNIRNWMNLRAEFALQYIGWIFLILFLSPFPGAVISTVLHWCGLDFPGRILMVPLCAYLLFPILFLSISLGEESFELFHRGVWSSPFRFPGKWTLYYLCALPLAAILLFSLIGGFVLVINFMTYSFWVTQIPFAIASIILCQTISWTTYLYFRLLGSLAWCIGWRYE